MPGGPIIYGDAVNRGHALNRGLVGWWLGLPGMSAGPRLLDINGTRNHGTLTNGPTWGPGPNGRFGALTFNGPNSDARATNSTFNKTITAATFAAFLRRTGNFLAATGIAMSRGGGGNVTGLASAYAGGSATNILGYTWNDDPGAYNWNSGLTIPADRWVLCVATVSATTVTAYLCDGSITTASNSIAHASTTMANLNIGADPGVADRTVSGAIQSSWMWDRVLSASEVFALYDQSYRGYPDLLRRRGLRPFGRAAAVGGGITGPLIGGRLLRNGPLLGGRLVRS